MITSFKKTFLYVLLVALVYIGVLWSWLQYSVISAFKYWDEVYALSCIPMLILSYKKSFFSKEDIRLTVYLCLFSIAGIVGNIITKCATLQAAISDLFLNIKFFMALFATTYLFRKQDIRKYNNRIKIHIRFLTIVFICLFLIDRLIHIFPVYEVRFGIMSEQLIFVHPTFCAAAMFYLILLNITFCGIKNLLDKISLLFLCIIVVMTLRFKAIATVLFFVALYFFIHYKILRNFRWAIIALTVTAVMIIAYDQVAFYFSGYGLDHFARGALLTTGIKIMRDYFPFGTGFATFGSYMSGVYYSPIYAEYGISTIGGIAKHDINAITDQYWPMIMGQTGVIGLSFMILCWGEMYKKIRRFRKRNNDFYIVGLSCFVYIILSSTSESAVCNPACFPFAILLGIVFSQKVNLRGDSHESKSNCTLSASISPCSSK